MKAIVKVFLVSLVVMLAGCNDEIGGGKNEQPTAQVTKTMSNAEAATELYGPVIHSGEVAPSSIVMVMGQDINESLSLISILTRGTKGKPGTAFMLACDTRDGTYALGGNIYQPDGQGTASAQDIAIMNFPKGRTEIREADDNKRAYFSTAEGDTDILGALKGLKKLDPESTIVFVTEETKEDGFRYSTGWSPMFKVKDVIAGLKKVDLGKCEGLDQFEMAYEFMPNESIIPSHKQ